LHPWRGTSKTSAFHLDLDSGQRRHQGDIGIPRPHQGMEETLRLLVFTGLRGRKSPNEACRIGSQRIGAVLPTQEAQGAAAVPGMRSVQSRHELGREEALRPMPNHGTPPDRSGSPLQAEDDARR
jgi:hypothetical protein